MNMNQPPMPASIGAALNGGFFAGLISDAGETFALFVAPKAAGEYAGPWSESMAAIDGAKSYTNGLANTIAMDAAGSKLGAWARQLRIAGADDWYVPSRDELEVIYRNLKPTTDENAVYGRHGENVAAVPPTHTYSASAPAQTGADLFKEGEAEAFDDVWYWSSTQHASDADYAWSQNFINGHQYNDHKSGQFRARAVRRIKI